MFNFKIKRKDTCLFKVLNRYSMREAKVFAVRAGTNGRTEFLIYDNVDGFEWKNDYLFKPIND